MYIYVYMYIWMCTYLSYMHLHTYVFIHTFKYLYTYKGDNDGPSGMDLIGHVNDSWLLFVEFIRIYFIYIHVYT
jgi:hypothetical protein